MSEKKEEGKQKDSEKENLDPEMLKNLDVLIDYDILASEGDWTQMEETIPKR